MKLYMTELSVTDIAKSLAWYRDKLGLHVRIHDTDKKYVQFDAGGQLSLREHRDTGKVDSHSIVYFEVEDLTAELARLSRLGIVPDDDTTESEEGYRRAILRDPDGHGIGLFEWIPKS